MNEAIAQAEKQRMMMIYGGIAVLAILVIGIVIGSIVVRKRRSKEFELPLTEEQINQEAATMMQIPIEREEPVAEPEISAEAKELMRRREQVEKVAKEHPDDVAQLLRTWLAEE